MAETYKIKVACRNCDFEGEVDIEKILNMKDIAYEDLEAINYINKDKINTLFKLHYDIIHILSEALLIFYRISSANHLCLFTYLCTKYRDFDWLFFEEIRNKRNDLNYGGKPINISQWPRIRAKMIEYIHALSKELESKIHNFNKP